MPKSKRKPVVRTPLPGPSAVPSILGSAGLKPHGAFQKALHGVDNRMRGIPTPKAPPGYRRSANPTPKVKPKRLRNPAPNPKPRPATKPRATRPQQRAGGTYEGKEMTFDKLRDFTESMRQKRDKALHLMHAYACASEMVRHLIDARQFGAAKCVLSAVNVSRLEFIREQVATEDPGGIHYKGSDKFHAEVWQ